MGIPQIKITRFIIKPGPGRVELGSGYISKTLLDLCMIQVLIIFYKVDGVYLYKLHFVWYLVGSYK